MTQQACFKNLRRGGGRPRSAAAIAITCAAAALLATALAPVPSIANPTSGMISGNYAVQLPASIYMRNSSGYTDVCIQITGTDRNATGTIKVRRHNGTWATAPGFLSVTLPLNREALGRETDWIVSWGAEPTNWRGMNRQFDQHGWRGKLNQRNELRIAVDNHILKMTGDGRRTMTHGSTCP